MLCFGVGFPTPTLVGLVWADLGSGPLGSAGLVEAVPTSHVSEHGCETASSWSLWTPWQVWAPEL